MADSILGAVSGFLGNDSIDQKIRNEGFAVPNAPAADGIGLPYTNIPANVVAATPVKRHLIHWLIPDMGVVKMYVNPERITYTHTKLIRNERTKGGYNIQYWGEDLTKINLSGSTGSSGIEGINVLYEVFRSEQFTFDSVGLGLAAASSASGAMRLASMGASALGNSIGGVAGAGIAQGLLGAGVSDNLAPRNIPSLANNAFTIEMYYNGWVYRGYFENMSITEDTSMIFTYNINFTATQRRGYRTNAFPWNKNPNNGGGDTSNDYNPITGEGISPSFNGKLTPR
jgi:hypothetical protein